MSGVLWPPFLVGTAAFVFLFFEPAATLVRDWLSDPDAAHGLLLAPLALYLAWKAGVVDRTEPRPTLGLSLLGLAVLLRFFAELAAELLTLRMSMLMAVAGLVVMVLGTRQLLRWWLPAALLILSVPLPEMVVSTVALPLQLRASAMGATLLEWRHVPIRVEGNVIYLPGYSLFVTEACSGLRSLSALVAIGVLAGGLFLRGPVARAAVLLATIPVAMFVNGIRVFLTGFLVYFVDPDLGTGFVHYSEGWALFGVSLVIIGGLTWVAGRAETRWGRPEGRSLPITAGVGA